MHKKIIFIISIILTTHALAGEICPTPSDIKNNLLHGWKAFDRDNGTPLSHERFVQFQTAVKKFSIAEWMIDAPEGEAHCYYDLPNLNAYLAKNGLIADKNLDSWQTVGYDVMQCHSSIQQCIFRERT